MKMTSMDNSKTVTKAEGKWLLPIIVFRDRTRINGTDREKIEPIQIRLMGVPDREKLEAIQVRLMGVGPIISAGTLRRWCVRKKEERLLQLNMKQDNKDSNSQIMDGTNEQELWQSELEGENGGKCEDSDDDSDLPELVKRDDCSCSSGGSD
jgi:hypothetical protein